MWLRNSLQTEINMGEFTRAIKCFNENVQLLHSVPTGETERNLNAGLYNLAEGLKQLEGKVDRLLSEMRSL